MARRDKQQQQQQQQQAHFLIVTYPAQGHVTPARHLARRFVRGGALATVCVPVSAFRKMFPTGEVGVEEEVERGGVGYAAYSDGYDGGFDRAVDDHTRYMAQVRTVGSRTLAGVLRRLRDGGRPVTCAVYTLLLPWVADVARENDVVATAVFWIQPVTALAAYYHYFRGHREAVVAAAASRDPCAEVHLPGLPAASEFSGLINLLDRRGGDSGEPPTYVLANTFDAMEGDSLASLRPHIEVVAVGPVLSFLHDADETKSVSSPNDLFDHDSVSYLDWLDTKPTGRWCTSPLGARR
ncbi:hypothetical protein GUJ93_ZPchr0010g9269 [Zizania palustris]|uniref:Glycosyltransferase n=1 Tax=Zizania palustris TaxID=103762 RepID=A0A8J6BGQ6_ZIZPA|nr:hypothetical protein GUJ93_ZPchr0010g9269 [Zizania palustris]